MTWTAIFVEIRFARGDFSEFGKSQFVWTTEVTLLAQHSNPDLLLPSFEGEYKYEGILNFISRVFISGIFTLFAYWSDCVDRNDKVFTLLYKIVMHKKVSHPDDLIYKPEI